MTELSTKIYEFDKFRLNAAEKTLGQGDSLADVTPKAIEILLVLVENAGRIVSKKEIFKQVWSDSFVEEANLSHHIFRLRKALGEDEERKFIETVPNVVIALLVKSPKLEKQRLRIPNQSLKIHHPIKRF